MINIRTTLEYLPYTAHYPGITKDHIVINEGKSDTSALCSDLYIETDEDEITFKGDIYKPMYIDIILADVHESIDENIIVYDDMALVDVPVEEEMFI